MRPGGDDLEAMEPNAHREVIVHGEERLIAAAADALAAGELVAWVEDSPEVEVRSRGRRVILCDPARAETVLRLRREVKLGEDYVPLGLAAPAPVVATWCEERARSATMGGLATATPGETVRGSLAGVLHVDRTTVVHGIEASHQPRLYRVMEEFTRRTGRVALAMTSFNRAGEPPVLRAAEAADLQRRAGIDVLFWGEREVRTTQPARPSH
jgi:carbamoyltransferase